MRRLALVLLVAGSVAVGDDNLTFDYRDVPAKKAVEVIATFSGAKILLDEKYDQAKLSLKVKGAPLDTCLEMLALAIDAKLFRHGPIYHIVPKWKHALLETLHNGQRVTLTFEKESTVKILGVIATYFGVPMVLDPELGDPKASVKLANATVSAALEQTLKPNAAGYDLRYGVVFIATKKRLAALPKRLGIPIPPRLEAERFTFSLSGESATRILEVVARKAGLGLDIDKAIQPALSKKNVAMQLSNARIEHILAAILAPAGAKAVIKDGKLIVTKA